MRRVARLVTVAVGLAVTACTSAGPSADSDATSDSTDPTVASTSLATTTTTTTSVKLASFEARELWESHGFESYRLVGSHNSFWHRPGTWDILVSGDDQLWMGSLNRRSPVSYGSDVGLFDVDTLFDFIRRSEAGSVQATFSELWGFPTDVSYDKATGVDEEWSLHLSWVPDGLPARPELTGEVLGSVDAIFEGTVTGAIGDFGILIDIEAVHFEHPDLPPGLFEGSIGAIDIREPNPIWSAEDWVGREIVILGSWNDDVTNLSKKDRPDSLWLIRAAGVRTPDGLQVLEDRFFTLSRRDLCGPNQDGVQPGADADLALLAIWADQIANGDQSVDPGARACGAAPDASVDLSIPIYTVDGGCEYSAPTIGPPRSGVAKSFTPEIASDPLINTDTNAPSVRVNLSRCVLRAPGEWSFVIDVELPPQTRNALLSIGTTVEWGSDVGGYGQRHRVVVGKSGSFEIGHSIAPDLWDWVAGDPAGNRPPSVYWGMDGESCSLDGVYGDVPVSIDVGTRPVWPRDGFLWYDAPDGSVQGLGSGVKLSAPTHPRLAWAYLAWLDVPLPFDWVAVPDPASGFAVRAIRIETDYDDPFSDRMVILELADSEVQIRQYTTMALIGPQGDPIEPGSPFRWPTLGSSRDRATAEPFADGTYVTIIAPAGQEDTIRAVARSLRLYQNLNTGPYDTGGSP